MLEIDVTGRWRKTFPGGHVGVLQVGNIDNRFGSSALELTKQEITDGLRRSHGGMTRHELLEDPILAAYRDYYRGFNKTYHVLLQLESVVNKGKSLPSISPLVDVNFAAELRTRVLTAGHDLDILGSPLTIDASHGGEPFCQMNGNQTQLKPNDMIMRDPDGVSCSIIYGQDNRSPISAETNSVVYVAYAPSGVPLDAVVSHFEVLMNLIRLFAEQPQVGYENIFSANPS